MDYILTFEQGDYEVLETIEFSEEVAKPQELRFYTLDEQLRDFFERSISGGKPTKFELKSLMYDRDRIRKAYDKLIVATDTDYLVNERRTSLNIPWIHPVYSEFKFKAYSVDKEFLPLFEATRIRQPNYYSGLINALPKPYSSTGNGRRTVGNFVDEEGKNPIIVLDGYVRSKKIIQDDGSFILVDLPMSEQDDVHVQGYYLGDRGVPIPNSLDHPFLKSEKPSFYKTDFDLLDVFPSVESIMEHGVPRTEDPYQEGLKFLKVYDLKLSQIPWNLWKSRFPPADQKHSAKQVKLIEFPKQDEKAPSDILLKSYSDWYPALNERYWLSLQVDSGLYVPRLLISRSSQHGLVALGSPEGPVHHPQATIDICQHLTSDFDSFLNSGVYRYGKKDKEGIEIEDGSCVTVGHIQQEKGLSITRDRLGWSESSESTIQSEYKKILGNFHEYSEINFTKYEKVETLQESERRKVILTILEDVLRSPQDKADAIELLLRDLDLENKQYHDHGLFVLCQHTMSILRGNLEENPRNFYVEWTVVALGKRVCKFCGEEVSSEVTVATDEYDENGHLVATYESLDSDMYVADGSISSFTNSLTKLRSVFDLNHGGEAGLFLLLATLQLLPQETQLVPVLGLMRDITKSLKSRKVSKQDQDRIESLLCIPALTILLQVHQPFLVPKRSVNNKPFKLSGFPRDSDDPLESPVLDSVVAITQKMLSEVPSRGPLNELSKNIVNLKKVRDETIPFLKVFASKFKSLLESAKERYEEPIEEEELNTIIFPFIASPKSVDPGKSLGPEELGECSGNQLIRWITKRLPSVSQPPLKLDAKIPPSPELKLIDPEKIELAYKDLSKKDIEQNVSLGLPKEFKMFSDSLKGDFYTFVSLGSRILDILATTAFDKKKIKELRELLDGIGLASASYMRDVAKGLFFQALSSIPATPMRAVLDFIKTDLVFKMLLQSKEKAEKEELELRTREKNELKSRYREMTDTRRELVKMLVDIGISEFIVTNEDRRRFAQQFQQQVEEEYAEQFSDVPEGDFRRDYVENGDQPIDVMGNALEVDFGDYGDRGVRDYNDYTAVYAFDEE
jgi:hypothetical protein